MQIFEFQLLQFWEGHILSSSCTTEEEERKSALPYEMGCKKTLLRWLIVPMLLYTTAGYYCHNKQYEID